MNSLFGSPFEQRDDRYYLFDRNGLAYALSREQFQRTWMRLFNIFTLQNLGLMAWLACALYIWVEPKLDPSDVIGPFGLTAGQVPDWVVNPTIIFIVAFFYWALIWRLSVTTWHALAPLAEPQSQHPVRGSANFLVLMSKPQPTLIMGLIAGGFLAAAFGLQ